MRFPSRKAPASKSLELSVQLRYSHFCIQPFLGMESVSPRRVHAAPASGHKRLRPHLLDLEYVVQVQHWLRQLKGVVLVIISAGMKSSPNHSDA